jgi:hypothetical protein
MNERNPSTPEKSFGRKRKAFIRNGNAPRHLSNRREFIKGAAMATAAAGAGGLLLNKNILPQSSASDAPDPPVTTSIIPCGGILAIWNCTSSITDTVNVFANSGASLSGVIETQGPCFCCINPLGAVLTVQNFENKPCSAPVGIAGLTEGIGPKCWPGRTAGVVGSANAGVGVSGSSIHGYGVYAAALGPTAVPIVAQGSSSQTANLQEWISPNNPESVVANNGFFGIGTTAPKSLLDVNGTIFGTSVGLGTTSPKTSLAVNGSVSSKAVFEKTNYSMGSSDFAVLAQAAITVTLPSASTAPGMIVFVKKVDPTTDGAVTVKARGTDVVEGTASRSLPKQYNSLTLISNGSNEWFILASAK